VAAAAAAAVRTRASPQLCDDTRHRPRHRAPV